MKEIYSRLYKQQAQRHQEMTDADVPENAAELTGDQSAFERIQLPESREISRGVTLELGNVKLRDGAVVNFADISFDPESSEVSTELVTKQEPLNLKRMLINDKSAVSVISGTFFFLATGSNILPKEVNFNLVVRDSRVVGLPVSDRPMLFIRNGKLEVMPVKARGVLQIGTKDYSWVGHRSVALREEYAGFVVYGTGSSHIDLKEGSEGSRRIFNPEKSRTPTGPMFTDLLVTAEQDSLKITDIKKGGGTNVLEANFIVQTDGSTDIFSIGDKIIPKTVDGLDMSNVRSAITLGPSVFDFLESGRNHETHSDYSFGGTVTFSDERAARTVVYMGDDSKIHFRVFDAVPKSEKQRGVSPNETAEILKTSGAKWAYHLDGGQSSKLFMRDESGKISTFGNHHYLRWPNLERHPYVWTPDDGRKMASAILLKKSSKHISEY